MVATKSRLATACMSLVRSADAQTLGADSQRFGRVSLLGKAGGSHRMATFSSFASMVPEPSVSKRSKASLHVR